MQNKNYINKLLIIFILTTGFLTFLFNYYLKYQQNIASRAQFIRSTPTAGNDVFITNTPTPTITVTLVPTKIMTACLGQCNFGDDFGCQQGEQCDCPEYNVCVSNGSGPNQGICIFENSDQRSQNPCNIAEPDPDKCCCPTCQDIDFKENISNCDENCDFTFFVNSDCPECPDLSSVGFNGFPRPDEDITFNTSPYSNSIDFGDGTPIVTMPPHQINHRYLDYGIYTITLECSESQTCTKKLPVVCPNRVCQPSPRTSPNPSNTPVELTPTQCDIPQPTLQIECADDCIPLIERFKLYFF